MFLDLSLPPQTHLVCDSFLLDRIRGNPYRIRLAHCPERGEKCWAVMVKIPAKSICTQGAKVFGRTLFYGLNKKLSYSRWWFPIQHDLRWYPSREEAMEAVVAVIHYFGEGHAFQSDVFTVSKKRSNNGFDH